MMCNWLQHFHHELSTSQLPKSPSYTKDLLRTIATTALPGIISNLSYREDVFIRLTLNGDNVLNLLVKLWFMPEVFLPNPHLLAGHRYHCYGLLHKSLAILTIHDPSGNRLAQAVQNILREAQGDTGVVAKKLLQQLRNPAKASTETFKHCSFSLKISYYLVYERIGDDVTGKLMENLLKGDLVQLTAQLLSFVSEDLANTPERRVPSAGSSSDIIEYSLRLLLRSMQTRSGPHWLTVLFKLGFLRSVSRIMSLNRCLTGASSEILTIIIGTIIPTYFCHRFVVVSAIKAVKEIMVNGDVTKLEASALQDSWMNFTNILLERAVINTVYERDWISKDVRKCQKRTSANPFPDHHERFSLAEMFIPNT